MTNARTTSVGTLVLLVAALLACGSEPTELPYARMGIVIADSNGAPVPNAAGASCVLLPVLRGSRLDETFPVAGSLSVAIAADREGVVVSFEHASPSVSDKSVSRKQLESGFFEEVEVWEQAGARYLVQLSSECEADAKVW